MAKNLQRTISSDNHFNPGTFGGIIYPSDFHTDYPVKVRTQGSVIAQRIISDQKFDEQCRRNAYFNEKKTPDHM